MPDRTSELLRTRERYFVEADLKKHKVLCGDERPADDIYIHLFGGVANTAYTLMALQEAQSEGSVSTPLDKAVVDTFNELDQAGIDAGVHSDDHSEHGEAIRTDVKDGDIGCGYLKLRQAISQGIADKEDEIVKILEEQDPELYGMEQNREKARGFARAHGRLATRDIFAPGRQIALAAIEAGAPSNVVRGDHVGKHGILDKRRGYTFDSAAAFDDGKPTYDHDSWAAKDTYVEIKDNYPFDETDYEIANDVDAVGTMLALGVEEIAVRR